jgi:hypothetical protein
MPKFIIRWNAGYGENAVIEECADRGEASERAY